jgi:hypothetical protein
MSVLVGFRCVFLEALAVLASVLVSHADSKEIMPGELLDPAMDPLISVCFDVCRFCFQ